MHRDSNGFRTLQGAASHNGGICGWFDLKKSARRPWATVWGELSDSTLSYFRTNESGIGVEKEGSISMRTCHTVQPAAGASMAYSRNPCGESLLQLWS